MSASTQHLLPDGTRIFVSHLLPPQEDWSEVRSPSRAKRRLARGFKQRIKYSENMSVTCVAGIMVMGPRSYDMLVESIRHAADRMSQEMDKQIMRTIMYGTSR